VEAREKERVKIFKQRGIMRRILDSNTRVMAQGYNKLLESSKGAKAQLKNKMRNLVKALTDKDTMYKLQAYNGLRQRCLMLNGAGMGRSDTRKVQLIRRLTNQTYNVQIMAINALKEFIRIERSLDEAYSREWLRQQSEKYRFCMRMMDSSTNLLSIAFRQSHDHSLASRHKEQTLKYKHRGILRRILSTNTQLLAKSYNKLTSQSKLTQSHLTTKLTLIIKSLTSKDTSYTLTAYNSLKHRSRTLQGINTATATMKKFQ
jgi:hypothetical protein